MRTSEAEWLGSALAEIDAGEISPLIELGSSTRRFRQEIQPHIDKNIHAPLQTRGVKVVHSDIKAEDGVDVAGDIYDPKVRAQLRAVGANCVLCCNMFEHVIARQDLAQICDEILAPGGYLLVTVPHSYPLHLDPIDTYFRPSPEELATLFPSYRLLKGAVVEDCTYADDLSRDPRLGSTLAKMVVRLFLFRGMRSWTARNHRLLWLWRRYKIAAVVLRKPV